MRNQDSAREAIDKIKRDGAVRALKERIQAIKIHLSQVWDGTEHNGKFIKLGTSIAMSREMLDMMRDTLDALAEMETGNQ